MQITVDERFDIPLRLVYNKVIPPTEEPMLQVRAKDPDLFDSLLPEQLRKLPEELERINQLLSDASITEPFIKRFNVLMGRPSVPVETYVRLMYLKFRHHLGYETLVAEVSDSYAWRRFCGIGMYDRVPDASTLIKLTHKYGAETIQEMHNALIAGLKAKKLIRGRKIRMDSTVVESNIHYPTDSSVLTDGLRRMRQLVRRIPDSGVRLGRTVAKAKKLIFAISQHLRKRGDVHAKKKITKINETIITMARSAANRIRKVLARHTVDDSIRQALTTTASLVEQIAGQSEQRLAGEKPQDRIISVADPDARPIVKGKLDKPVQFGRVAALVQDESGYITVQETHQGNPADVTMTQRLVQKHQQHCPGALKAIATDTGFSSQENSAKLAEAGVTRICMPVRGKPSALDRQKQQRAWFKKLRAFRAGIEGVISFLKRKFGFGRSMFRGNSGTAVWVGWAVIAANLYRYGVKL